MLGKTAACALTLVALALGCAGYGANDAAAFAPTPTSPIYGGIPGALPPGFHYFYNDNYQGWPVNPQHAQHPIRGSFLDPRGHDDTGLSGYHFGIDINVDDQHPEPGAPPLLSHRVYALESGRVSTPANGLARPCLDRRLEVGHFAYWHVSPIVSAGQFVHAGQQIGWTCLGVWHVHLSEWQIYQGKLVWVNPLHRGGHLGPYTDTAAPVVSTMRFVTPPARPWAPNVSLAQPDTSTRLAANDLHGLVELRAQIGDPQSFLGFLTRNPVWPIDFAPYRVTVQIRELRTGRTVMSRISFQADQLPQTPYIVHYAPGTIEDDNFQECIGPPQLPKCIGTYWFRPFSRFHEEYWNTGAVPNGSYAVTVRAYDIKGNLGSNTTTVTVKNSSA